ALTQTTGSFEQAVLEFGRVVNIRGRVLPSTLDNVTLCARFVDGTEACGESQISSRGTPIAQVYFDEGKPLAYPPALEAIVNADLIVLGPGSLYTSVVPNLLVDGILEAIRWSRGTTVYVCNVATQQGETDHFTAGDHIRVVQDYLGEDNLDFAVVNSNRAAAEAIRPELNVEAVIDTEALAFWGTTSTISQDVVSDANPLRHDPEKLTAALMTLARRPKAATGAVMVADSRARATIR
ncbi:MAG: 2-phospho-L-lactate transferase CofD family protein, partial [Thermomicrobiales bacterium]